MCFRSKFALKTYSKGKKEMESNGKNNSEDFVHIQLKTAAIKVLTSTPSVIQFFNFTDLIRT